MTGVDASDRVVARGRRRTAEEGLEERVRFVHADACASGLPDASADFVWGEDAWCYVADKARLVHEAARIVRPGGVIAFTDWVEGPAGLSATEADRLLHFMKFPSLQDIPGYAGLLAGAGCEVITAEDTGRFAPCMDLYHAMVEMQLGWDAMRIVGFDLATMGAIAGEMQFVRELGHAGKLAQGRFVARAGDRGTT